MKTKIFTIVSLIILSFSGLAQDLSNRNYAPLYDCSIFPDRDDRGLCLDAKKKDFFGFEDNGLAVDCYSLKTARRNSCLDLADRVLANPSIIDCGPLYRDSSAQRQCQTTKKGYERGEFRKVPVNVPVVDNSCSAASYDRAMRIWEERVEQQRKKAKTRATVGIVATIGGIILGSSNDGTTRAIGNGLTVGGVALTAWGLLEMADADLSLPHLNPNCSNFFKRETRMVIVERRECVTTQYTEHGWNRTRSYYEVRCQDRQYVTFEEFSPWYDGRPTNYYYRY